MSTEGGQAGRRCYSSCCRRCFLPLCHPLPPDLLLLHLRCKPPFSHPVHCPPDPHPHSTRSPPCSCLLLLSHVLLPFIPTEPCPEE